MAILGSAPGIILGTGVGFAASAALAPAVEVPKQDAWLSAPHRVLDAGTIARLIAEGGVPLDANAYEHAKRTGYDTDKLDALVYLAQTVPGSAEALFLWRLGYTDEHGYRQALTKLGIREDWQDRMVKTFHVPLTAAEAAIAIHHNVIPNQGQLPGLDLDTEGKVLRFPKVDIDAYQSAEAYGVDNAQLDAITRTLGLPPGLDMVARMVFRGILDRGDFTLAALQSNRRTEWQEFEFEGYRQIPTSHEFTEGHLRGYLTRQEMYDGTAQHGMTQENTDLLYANAGRPLNIHQITTGQARGGKYGGTYDDVPEGPYRDAIIRGPLRPEFAALDYANRYNYPSPFVIRSLAQAGTLGGTDDVKQLLLEIGWKPELATKVATDWTTGGGSDSHVAKAETQLWTTTHRSYIAAESDDATATAALEAAGVDAGSVPAVLELWKTERELVRKQLTPAQIKKAYKESAVNAETGVAWTRDEALAALIARGYSPTDADSFLNI